MRSRAAGHAISITGLGCYVPERVLTNDEIAGIVDTSDEWISSRTGIRERRVAAEHEAMSDLALPAARRALEQAGVRGSDLQEIIVATVTPDSAFPPTAALLADRPGRARARRRRRHPHAHPRLERPVDARPLRRRSRGRGARARRERRLPRFRAGRGRRRRQGADPPRQRLADLRERQPLPDDERP